MSDIEWQNDAVCCANGKQWVLNEGSAYSNKPIVSEDKSEFVSFEYIMRRDDFQLNEITTGDYITASELDTEQKYNEVVEVFVLFGFNANENTLHYNQLNTGATHYFASSNYGIDSVSKIEAFKRHCKGRQLTYHQIIAIGKLKRMMLDKLAKDADDAVDELVNMVTPTYVDVSHLEVVSKLKSYSEAVSDVTTNKSPKRKKSKQAYDILKSLDYEYDLVKQKWYRKEWVI